jgi:DNA invertase Pin-like site-specific DNA recombinase
MLTAARSGRIDVVVAVNLDRLLRTQGDLLALIETGAKVVTLEGELDLASASGEMQAAVLTAMARFEARR